MFLTNYTIEQMGFTKYPETDVLKASFYMVKIYSLKGIVFDEKCDPKQSEVISFGLSCNAIISQSINLACKTLTGDYYTEDEEKWLSEKRASPPFLVITYLESEPRTASGGYRQEKEGKVYSYGAFPDVKIEMREWEKNIEPRIITALAVNLSTLENQVEIEQVDKSIFGRTTAGNILFDLFFTGSASGYCSQKRNVELMSKALLDSEKLFLDLTTDSVRHFYLALNEKDRLKRFLGLFFFIERFTHRTFKLLNYNSQVNQFFNIPQRVEKTSAEFFSSSFSEAKNLLQRFHWCSLTVWKQIDDRDISDFLEIKGIRDKLAHGEHINEASLPVEKSKTLALKLLGTAQQT